MSDFDIRFMPVAEALRGSQLDGDDSLTQQVYRLLRNIIIDLRLMPNQFLSEKDVAAELDVSKTPVREAFIRLADDGMVRIVPKSGTYVSPIDFNRAKEGYFIWRSLESACASEVAENRSMEDIFYFRTNLDQQKQALAGGDYVGFYYCDNQFHDAMFRIAGYPNAKHLIETAKFEVDRIRNLKMRYRLRPIEEVHDEHTEIVDAIVNRDAEAARGSMYRHLSRVKDSLESLANSENLWELFHQMSQSGPGKRGPRTVAADGKTARATRKLGRKQG